MTGSAAKAGRDLAIGDEIELDIGPVAHRGVCVGRIGADESGAGGRVVFVRYALPGERAVVRITEMTRRFCRGEAVRIVRADPQRATPPCAHFGPGGCGGCDWQHAAPERQRELKASVVAEQLWRLAGIDVPVTVEPLPGGGLGWRTRVRWAVGGEETAGYDAVVGPRRYRSHEPVPISAEKPCLIAARGINEHVADLRPTAGRSEVTITTAGVAERGETLTEWADGRAFVIESDGFWQAHAHAADTFGATVRDLLADAELAGATAWDLYGGAGLFAALLAELVGERGRVVSVESDRAASRHAAANLADLPQVTAVQGRVDRMLTRRGGPLGSAANVVILDPPRSGAGTQVCRAIARRAPERIVYVACDPASLGRDTAALRESGYELASLRAFDAFPQTHHVECVALFSRTPDGRDGRRVRRGGR